MGLLMEGLPSFRLRLLRCQHWVFRYNLLTSFGTPFDEGISSKMKNLTRCILSRRRELISIQAKQNSSSSKLEKKDVRRDWKLFSPSAECWVPCSFPCICRVGCLSRYLSNEDLAPGRGTEQCPI